MIQVDLQASFLIGSAVALVSRRRLYDATEQKLAELRTVVLAFAATVFAPVWLYITWRWTGWEMMYWWDRDTVPPYLVAVFLPLVVLSALYGFRVTAHLIRSDRFAWALAIIGAVFATCVAVAVIGWDRVTYVGTVAGFEAGERNNVLGSEMLMMFGLGGLVVFGPTATLVIYKLRRDEPAGRGEGEQD